MKIGTRQCMGGEIDYDDLPDHIKRLSLNELLVISAQSYPDNLYLKQLAGLDYALDDLIKAARDRQ